MMIYKHGRIVRRYCGTSTIGDILSGMLTFQIYGCVKSVY